MDFGITSRRAIQCGAGRSGEACTFFGAASSGVVVRTLLPDCGTLDSTSA